MRTRHWSRRNAIDPGSSGRPRGRTCGIHGSTAATAAACALTFLSGLGWAAEPMPDGGNAPAVDATGAPQLTEPEAGPQMPDASLASPYEAAAAPDAVTMAAVAATSAAGRTPGTFGVTSSGAATYRIPIWTPPGVGSVELDLALVYNSRGGNGVMGQGWSLSGLSAITRCNRTMAQDGAPAAVTNTLADRYCLDGQQLKLVSGGYGTPGSVYATEIESFSRVVANGTAGNGPASFTVTSKNGLVYEYGTTTDSQVYAGASGTIRTWALARVRDRAATTDGNSISIAYVNEAQNGAYTNGSYRVSAITYPRTASGQGPFYRVSFGYSARPTTDVLEGFVAGDVVRESSQLDSITVSSHSTGATIKTYRFSYAPGVASGRLQLRSVQECSATACLAPTTVGYQQGSRGWGATFVATGYQASGKTGLFPVDLNGDGITDILYPNGIGDGVMRWWVLFGQPGGYGAPVDTGITLAAGVRIIPGRFLGNGRSQFLVPLQSTWHVVDYWGTSFLKTSTGLVPAGEFEVADVDGDGLDDLVSYDSTTADCFKVRRNVTIPAAGSTLVTFAPTSEAIGRPPKGGVHGSGALRVADLNGDGRDDMVVHTFVTTRRGGSWITPFLSNGFGTPFTVGASTDFWLDAQLTVGDWNGDGCTDILQAASVQLSNCAGGFGSVDTGAVGAVYDFSGMATVLAADWDEDGRTDLLYVSTYGGSGNRWYVVRSTGNGAAVPVSTGVGAPNSTSWFGFDADGDGKTDLGYRDDNHNGSMRYYRHNAPGAPADLATSFSDGFGMSQSPSYVSIATGNYTKHDDAVYPEVDFRGPLYVVSQFAATDGTGSTYQNRFQYYGARVHLQGRGFEGFHSQRTYDSRSGTYTFDYLQRAFPYTGMHTQRTVWQSNLSSRLSERSATVERKRVGAPGLEERVLPFLSTVTDSRFEAGGSLNGVLVTQATESYVYDDFGNRTQVQRIVTDKDPGSPFSGASWQTTATTAFANDPDSNCLGIPTSMVVTQLAPGQASRTRTTEYTVDTGPCRVTRQVIEPGSPTLKVTTALGFDVCGNVSSLQVVGSTPGGSPVPARTTSFGYGARCQLPESMTNALGQATSVAYQYDFGVPLMATDPNNLSTSWQYDDFGRRTRETRPDQTTTYWSFESCTASPCWGANDLRFRVYETSKGSAADTYQQRELFYDGYQRLRSDQRFRVLGVWTTENFTYDSLGRLVARDQPRSSGSNGYFSWTYDLLDRVTAQRLYQANGALDRSTALSYAGRTVRITDPLGRTRTRVVDVAGRLRRVTDPSPGGTTHYDYDSLGGLNRILDPIGAVSTGAYNVRGFRTQWADADRGTWTFAGNSLNELVAWTDARGQSFGATYDALGRMTSRTEPDGTSTWTWGASPAARNVGRLQLVTGYGYTESLAYDGLGRVATRNISTDQGYRYDYTYNSIGALDTIEYPTSPVPAGQGAARFKLQYAYSYGTPARITDVTDAPATSRTLWTLNAANDYSSATSETLGANLLAVASGYKSWTNELASRQSGVVPATSNRQNLAYQWDAAGNLTQRQDLNRALSENFTLDALDRIQSSTLNGLGNFAAAYDASGNITARSDTGTYTYGDPAHPHAVTAAGSHTYSYDANGNQITRDGASQAWASFNLPVLLAQPIGGTTYQSQFSYGPDHRRWRQIASYSNGTETTLYVGGLLEKESATSTGRTYWRHYVPTPSGMTIVVSRNSDASTSTSYLLTDHLGSSDAVLDASGNVVARASFTAFGTRRGGDWSSGATPDWAGIANTSRHGYTGHEHLDNLALVHMNGRVYDPAAGRFLSVDPMLGDPGDSQQLNPYAYAGNRPLAYTDPSGHDVVCGGMCVALAVSAIKTVGNYIFGGSEPYRPPATNMPGQLTQAGMGVCNPGRSTPACGGWLLSATASGRAGPAIPSSTWVNEADPADPYARESLEQLFIDLGTNAIDVVILAPYYDARGTYDAAREGDYLVAVISAGMTICDVAKPCSAVGAALKPVARAAKGMGRAGSRVREAAQSGPVIIGETMTRVEQAAARMPGSKILDDMPDFRATDMSPDQVTSAMMQYNRKWILEQTRSGRQIIDIGRDANRARPSIFYDMERKMLRNYQRLHPEFNGAKSP